MPTGTGMVGIGMAGSTGSPVGSPTGGAGSGSGGSPGGFNATASGVISTPTPTPISTLAVGAAGINSVATFAVVLALGVFAITL